MTRKSREPAAAEPGRRAARIALNDRLPDAVFNPQLTPHGFHLAMTAAMRPHGAVPRAFMAGAFQLERNGRALAKWASGMRYGSHLPMRT